MRWYFSLRSPRGGCGEGLQSVLENSAWERLRTKTVGVVPSGQSRSLHGFLGSEVGLGMEAKGRSGREVGKCGFASVGGTDDLDAPMARGEETDGREYITSGNWGKRTCEKGWEEGKSKERLTSRGGGGGELRAAKTSFERIYKRMGRNGCPQRNSTRNLNRAFCWGGRTTSRDSPSNQLWGLSALIIFSFSVHFRHEYHGHCAMSV